jgi:hypothetical protein
MSANNQPNDANGNMGISDETNNKQNDNNISGPEKWLDEHGNPNYFYLESLAEEDTLESLEALKEIADEYNVNYNTDDTTQVLVDKIVFAMKKDADDESM